MLRDVIVQNRSHLFREVALADSMKQSILFSVLHNFSEIKLR